MDKSLADIARSTGEERFMIPEFTQNIELLRPSDLDLINRLDLENLFNPHSQLRLLWKIFLKTHLLPQIEKEKETKTETDLKREIQLLNYPLKFDQECLDLSNSTVQTILYDEFLKKSGEKSITLKDVLKDTEVDETIIEISLENLSLYDVDMPLVVGLVKKYPNCQILDLRENNFSGFSEPIKFLQDLQKLLQMENLKYICCADVPFAEEDSDILSSFSEEQMNKLIWTKQSEVDKLNKSSKEAHTNYFIEHGYRIMKRFFKRLIDINGKRTFNKQYLRRELKNFDGFHFETIEFIHLIFDYALEKKEFSESGSTLTFL